MVTDRILGAPLFRDIFLETRMMSWIKNLSAPPKRQVFDSLPKKKLNLVIQRDLFGMVKWPLKGLSDLQLGNQKVTLNHLEEEVFREILGLEVFSFKLSPENTKSPSNLMLTPPQKGTSRKLLNPKEGILKDVPLIVYLQPLLLEKMMAKLDVSAPELQAEFPECHDCCECRKCNSTSDSDRGGGA